MIRCNCLRSLIPALVLLAGVMLSHPAFLHAQIDAQAERILALYNSGKKDTAYVLIDTLKKTARFVPSVMFVRAQMTPDDRALPLYKEVIALDPQGKYADRSALELVHRYIEKHDSLASTVWLNVLRTRYPNSTYLASAETAYRSVKSWKVEETQPTKKPTTTSKDSSKTTHTPKTPPTTKLHGYALQVGLFATRDQALESANGLKEVLKQPVLALPKLINNERQYAVVIGPFKTLKLALAEKAKVATACGCTPFAVKVE